MTKNPTSSLTHHRYLEEDPSTTVLERQRRLPGYELYLVEQWACSRVHPTFVITTYTGLEQHSVLVSVLSIPTNQEAWSPRLRIYLQATTKFHARKKETPLGTLMVTNLSGFPSALTVVPVPEGNIIKHRVDFVVNENLKRMGCSGRAGLHLSPPIDATQAAFMRLYKTSDRVSIYSSVIELVKLCQVALIFYNKLAPEYADGLLCDVTEQAINDWWSDIGTEFFNADPTDGILGPTTVAALLGTLLGARNRLAAYGAPVAKDVFDLTSTKRGIASFQKSQKLERTRRFDRQTLDRLHKVTAKAVSGQGWTVPRAVKSTVAELSGKGGHIVMGMVGGREKVGIAEIETLDIDTFVQLAYGERCKWLWHGKPLKGNDAELFNNAPAEDNVVFIKDEHGGYNWSSSRRNSGTDDNSRPGAVDRTYNLSSHGSLINFDPMMKDTAPRRTVLKSVTERMTDARTGLGRIKEAVGKTGLRGHYHKHSKDENPSDGESTKERPSATQPQHFWDKWTPPQELTPAVVPEEPVYAVHTGRDGSSTENSAETPKKNQSTALEKKTLDTDADSVSSLGSEPRNLGPGVHAVNHIQNMRLKDRYSTPSLDSLNLAELPNTSEIWPRMKEKRHSAPESDQPLVLQKTKSLPNLRAGTQNSSYEARWPRHLSFSDVVDVVAAGVDTATSDDFATRKSLDAALAVEDHLATCARYLATQLQALSACDGSWVEQSVEDVHDLDAQYGKDQETLNQMYHQKLEEYNGLRDISEERVAEKTASLADTTKEIENLAAKLEYELTALQLKIKDVENGATEFERQVLEIEARAEELHEETRERTSWLSWPWRIFAGVPQPAD